MTKMGYCGDVCDYCPRYIATESGNKEKLKEVAVLWFKAGARDAILPPEEMTCTGCSPVKACQYGIAQCASKKNIKHCAECSDYPCSILQSRFDLVSQQIPSWKNACTREEWELVHEAFFRKKENLDRARQHYLAAKSKRTRK